MLLKSSQTILLDRRQKRDAMIGTRHIEIDARDVSEIAAVLMSLKKEMPAIIVASRRATGIMIKNQIRVFIRLSATASAQVAESRDHARWILKQIEAFDRQGRSKLRRKTLSARSRQDWLPAHRLLSR